MGKLNPLLARDWRQGRYIPTAVSNFLVPENSVADSNNINFDTVVGSGVVRPGTTQLGSDVSTGHAPLGLAEFVNLGATANYLYVVYKGASDATLYFWNGSTWAATDLTALDNTVRDRFAVLGGNIFITNSVNGMQDSEDGTTFTNVNSIPSPVTPSLIYRYSARMLASGYPTFPSRVYFSSIVQSSQSPFITWDVDDTTGDWIDVNPDDGGRVTGFSETSTFVVVFKNNGMYRLDTIAKTTDPDNIFNIGAIAQEGIVACQGIVYFFSGIDIRRTNGGFPEQISRAGVQDIIDAIPTANWVNVAAGTDGLNVYFSVGDVTLGLNTDDQRVLNNCVLKFSPRDQNWSVHTYADEFQFFSLYTNSDGRLMRGADTAGRVQTLNLGTADRGTIDINYEMTTQDMEFGNRAHLKGISDQLVVFTKNGQDSSIQALCDGVLTQIPMTLTARVNYGKDVNLEGHFFQFRWFGQSKGTAPQFEGLYIENIEDKGLTNP